MTWIHLAKPGLVFCRILSNAVTPFHRKVPRAFNQSVPKFIPTSYRKSLRWQAVFVKTHFECLHLEDELRFQNFHELEIHVFDNWWTHHSLIFTSKEINGKWSKVYRHCKKQSDYITFASGNLTLNMPKCFERLHKKL